MKLKMFSISIYAYHSLNQSASGNVFFINSLQNFSTSLHNSSVESMKSRETTSCPTYLKRMTIKKQPDVSALLLTKLSSVEKVPSKKLRQTCTQLIFHNMLKDPSSFGPTFKTKADLYKRGSCDSRAQPTHGGHFPSVHGHVERRNYRRGVSIAP